MKKREQIIEVIAYDPNWIVQFKQEARFLRNIFSENLVDIQHIGSTAVIDLAAKPTIDILLIVNDIVQVDQYNHLMAEIGYEAWGEYHISGRRFFLKGEVKRTYHIHTFEVGSQHILRHIAVRDYLQNHPKEAADYAALKIQLAKSFRNNRCAYVIGKHDYVKSLEKKAISWLNKFTDKWHDVDELKSGEPF